MTRQYKMTVPTGGVLYVNTDGKSWQVELRGADKWRPVQQHDDPIWYNNRTWSSIPDKLGIAPEVWDECRQGIQAQDSKADEPPSPEELEGITPEILAKAIDILKTGDPVKYFLDVFNKIHVGDRDLGQIMMYCTGSQVNKTSRGLHPKLSGESGMGKSDAVETYLHLLPGCAYLKTSLSSKAIFYHDIQPGTLIFLDDYKQNDELDAIIKQTSSRFHAVYEHRTIDKDRKAQVLTAPPEIVWAITSVDSSQDIQVLNRQVGLDVDGSDDQTKLVVAHLFEAAGKGEERFPVTEEVLVCRAMVLEIKKHCFKVTIPYWDRISWNDYSSRRNPSIFLDMVRSNAVWFFMQRVTSEDDVIEASEDDFHAAKALYVGRADTLIDKLSKAERKLAELIIAAGGELYRDEAAAKLGVSVNRISQLVHGENGKTGLTQKLPGFAAERAQVKGETRNVSKCVLTLANYDRFAGYDSLVVLGRKSGVSKGVKDKIVSSDYNVSKVSNIDNIYERDFTTHTENEIDFFSSTNPKNALLPYTLPPDSENSVKNGVRRKSPEIDDQVIAAMEEERKREEYFNKKAYGQIAAKPLSADEKDVLWKTGEFTMSPGPVRCTKCDILVRTLGMVHKTDGRCPSCYIEDLNKK